MHVPGMRKTSISFVPGGSIKDIVALETAKYLWLNLRFQPEGCLFEFENIPRFDTKPHEALSHVCVVRNGAEIQTPILNPEYIKAWCVRTNV